MLGHRPIPGCRHPWCGFLRYLVADAGRAVALMGMMAVVSGFVCILAGVARPRVRHRTSIQTNPLWISDEWDRTDGADQPSAPKFFGFSVEDAGPLRELWTIGKLILDGKANWTAHLRLALARWR